MGKENMAEIGEHVKHCVMFAVPVVSLLRGSDRGGGGVGIKKKKQKKNRDARRAFRPHDVRFIGELIRASSVLIRAVIFSCSIILIRADAPTPRRII